VSLRIGQQISINGKAYSVIRHSLTLDGRPYCIIEGRNKFRDMLTIDGIVRQNPDGTEPQATHHMTMAAGVR
jgi:hypothetical protein